MRAEPLPNTARTPVERAAPASGTKLRLLRPTDVLLPVAVALWAVGVDLTSTDRLGQFGLLDALPPAFYAGVAVLVVSIGVALASRPLSRPRLVAHLAVLLTVLYGTAPLVYTDGRYAWLYKTIGVVQYVNRYGHLDRHIDIYQNWPGFFALVAWFDKIAGVQSPIGYAKWAQLGFEGLTCLVLAFAFKALPITDRERWLALFLYVSTIWIAQDYLSPQALGTVLSAGILALVLHWLSDKRGRSLVHRADARIRRALHSPLPSSGSETGAGHGGSPQPLGAMASSSVGPQAAVASLGPVPPADPSAAPVSSSTTGIWRRVVDVPYPAVLVSLLLVYFVLVVVHELSPYIVLAQLGVLTVLGLVRPRWVVVVLAAIAFGYLAPRASFVQAHYGLLSSIGQFFSNVNPPSAALGASTVGVQVAADASRLLSVGMWLLAGVGAARRWRAGKPTLGLLALSVAPVAVLLAEHYGGEAILRVYLFSLPWTACLAASALQPRSARAHKARAIAVPAIALAVALTLFLPAFFGNDSVDVMPSSQVDAIQAFYRSATPGTVFAPNSNFPSSVTGHYNEFVEAPLFGPYGPLRTAPVVPSDGATVTRSIEGAATPTRPLYVVITGTMRSYAKAYGFPRPAELGQLQRLLSRTSGWILVHRSAGVTIYELR